MITELAPFALGTFDSQGRRFAGLVIGERVLDVGSVSGLPDTAGSGVRALIEDWDAVLPLLSELAGRSSSGSWHDLSDLKVLAPLAPRQIIQAGANYRTHVIDLAVKHAEIGDGRTIEQIKLETAAMMDRRAASGVPYFFIGLPSAVAGPYDEVVLPGYSTQHDWELELAVVIGRPAWRVTREAALEHVAGYTMVNDLTTRDLVFRRDMKEIGTDWYRSKNAPGFLPTGPFVVPAHVVGDPSALRVTLKLNGQVMQDEATSDMIFDVPALVSAASQITTLLPGDLVLTGSPAGNGLHHGRLLRVGDVMDCTITHLGTQRTLCIAEDQAAEGDAAGSAAGSSAP